MDTHGSSTQLHLLLGTSLLAVTGFLAGVTPAAAQTPDGHKPDIEIDTVSYDADCEAGTLFIEVRVRNLGRVDTGSFAVGLEFNFHRKPPRMIGNLAPQRSKAVSWTVNYDGGEELDREHADIRDHVRESNETNNAFIDGDDFCFE